ncbi:hypothetical protein EK21DRAFT_51395, partial [Setomelanomma holmii]
RRGLMEAQHRFAMDDNSLVCLSHRAITFASAGRAFNKAISSATVPLLAACTGLGGFGPVPGGEAIGSTRLARCASQPFPQPKSHLFVRT